MEHKSYCRGGGHPLGSVLMGLLNKRFIEHNLPNTQWNVVAHFGSGAPKVGLESLYESYEQYVKTLPNYICSPSKNTVTTLYVSTLWKLEDFQTGKTRMITAETLIKALVELSTVLNDAVDHSAGEEKNLYSVLREVVNNAADTVNDSDLENLKTTGIQLSKQWFESLSAWDKLQIDWQQYHPKSRHILDDVFFWDPTNDFSPNGNDFGWDILEAFLSWRQQNPAQSSEIFFDEYASVTDCDLLIAATFAAIKVDLSCPSTLLDKTLDCINLQRDEWQNEVVPEVRANFLGT
jgi:uncharacterized protein YfeS